MIGDVGPAFQVRNLPQNASSRTNRRALILPSHLCPCRCDSDLIEEIGKDIVKDLFVELGKDVVKDAIGTAKDAPMGVTAGAGKGNGRYVEDLAEKAKDLAETPYVPAPQAIQAVRDAKENQGLLYNLLGRLVRGETETIRDDIRQTEVAIVNSIRQTEINVSKSLDTWGLNLSGAIHKLQMTTGVACCGIAASLIVSAYNTYQLQSIGYHITDLKQSMKRLMEGPTHECRQYLSETAYRLSMLVTVDSMNHLERNGLFDRCLRDLELARSTAFRAQGLAANYDDKMCAFDLRAQACLFRFQLEVTHGEDAAMSLNVQQATGLGCELAKLLEDLLVDSSVSDDLHLLKSVSRNGGL